MAVESQEGLLPAAGGGGDRIAEVELDVVLLGATGFTGTFGAEYLLRHYGPTSAKPLRVGLAGRSLRKLIHLRDKLEFCVAAAASEETSDGQEGNQKRTVADGIGGNGTSRSSSSNVRRRLLQAEQAVGRVVCRQAAPQAPSPPPLASSAGNHAGSVVTTQTQKQAGDDGGSLRAEANRQHRWSYLTSLQTVPQLASLPLLEADASDFSSLLRLTRRSRCVVNFAGPYQKYGEPVIRACLETSTHYCDLSGEFGWVRAMQLKYGQLAAERGIKVVHFCGFECLPVDIACALVQRYALSKYSLSCSELRVRIRRLRNGVSMGTLRSAFGILLPATSSSTSSYYHSTPLSAAHVHSSASTSTDPNASKKVAPIAVASTDPCYFCRSADGTLCSAVEPANTPLALTIKQKPAKFGWLRVGYEADVGFIHPFPTEFLSCEVVNWTHMVLHYCKEPKCSLPKAGSFAFSECFAFGKNWFLSILLGLFLGLVGRPIWWLFKWLMQTAAMQFVAGRCLFAENLSGAGYTPDSGGGLECSVLAVTEADQHGDTHSVTCDVAIKGDPGYVQSAAMAVECGVCIATDLDRCPPTAGVLTPAAALFDGIVERLNEKGDITFSIAS